MDGRRGTRLDLLRRKQGIYGDLARLTDVEPMIDLITGTSAGGLNGTLLSAAIAWESDLEPLHDLWLGEGDFQELLRPLSQKNPVSLLRGDDYFLKIVQQALGNLHSLAGSDGPLPGPGQPGYPPLHAVITTTLMRAFNHEEVDALGQQMSSATHLGLFRFCKSPEASNFGDRVNADVAIGQLARAARSSASFPVAFEPSFVTIGPGDPEGADLSGIADFGSSRFVMDGGLMDNEPIQQLLDLIADQPASESPVRRVLLYVEPLAGPSKGEPADVRTDLPPLKTVLLDTITVPRQQSTAEQIDRLTQRANQHDVIQQVRAALFTPMVDLDTARSLVYAAERLRPVVQQVRLGNTEAKLRLATAADPQLAQARQNVLTTLDLLRRWLFTGLEPGDVPTQRAQLSQVLDDLRQTAESNKTNDAAAEVTTRVVERTTAAVQAAMTPLFEMSAADHGDLDNATQQLLREIEGIRTLAVVRMLRLGAASEELGQPDAASLFEALTDLDVLQSAATDGQSHNPQQIDLIQISSVVTAGSPDRIWPLATELTGIQLMHFGAFYLSGWRQNDWIAGRLNGSHELISMLADPVALLRHDSSIPNIVNALAQLLTVTRPEHVDAFRDEITPLLEAASQGDETAVTKARQRLTAYLAREAAYQILPGELNELRTQLKLDGEQGATLTPADELVLKSPDLGANPPADDIERVWNACAVGSDTLGEQVGSDRFAQIATQAAAVGVGLIETQKLPVVNKIAALLRPALRFAHFLTTPQASDRSNTFVIGAVMLAASFLALVCAATSSSVIYMATAGALWLGVVIAGVLLRHWSRVLGALVFLAATIGLGLASRHWHNPALLVLGAGMAVIASFVAMYACHIDRPRPKPAPRSAQPSR